MLRVGSPSPTLKSEDHRGRTVDLEAMRAQGPVVLFFYPADFTPVCTKEACGFQAAQPDFAALGAQIVGISADPPQSHRKFAQRYGLDYSLVTDPGDLADRFGVARPFGLGTRRVTYVIDPEGIVRGAFHHELRAEKHLKQVSELLHKLTRRPIRR
jgi:peroxiredoxin Q/BCP